MQRPYDWLSTRVRDLLDSFYLGYPSEAIRIWETDEPFPEQDFAVGQQANPYAKTQLTTSSSKPFSRAQPPRARPTTSRAKEPALYVPEVQQANGEQPFES